MHPFRAAVEHGRRAVKSGEYLIVRRSRKMTIYRVYAAFGTKQLYNSTILQTLTVL